MSAHLFDMPADEPQTSPALAALRPLKISKTQLKLLDFASRQELEDVRENVGYSPRILAQVSLPYSDPGDVPSWNRTNGHVSISMRPALFKNPDKSEYHAFAYGLIPRQALTFFATEAVRTQDPTIVLGRSMREFMLKIGLHSNGRDSGRLTNQLNRLLGSNLRVEGLLNHENGHAEKFRQFYISEGAELWFGKDSNLEDLNEGLFTSEITLSSVFFQSIIDAPVPVNLDAMRALGSSSMRLDILLWASYRVYNLNRPQSMRWSELDAQFGGQFSLVRQFKAAFLKNLRAVAIVYPELNFEVTKDFLILKPSKPMVTPRKRRVELV